MAQMWMPLQTTRPPMRIDAGHVQRAPADQPGAQQRSEAGRVARRRRTSPAAGSAGGVGLALDPPLAGCIGRQARGLAFDFMPHARSREGWIAEFVTLLVTELRPDLGSKFARTIAVQQYVQHSGLDPAAAAKRWVAQSAKPKRR